MALNILVVDTNQQFLDLVDQHVAKTSDKYRVYPSQTAIHALELMQRTPFSLVVTEIHMPPIDGFKFLQKIKKLFPDIPVVVATGSDTPETKEMAFKAGADAYHTKPLMMDKLINSIEALTAKQIEGGHLHKVSLEMFVQLIEMEAKTCTLRVKDEISGKEGVLFFKVGELIHARFNTVYGRKAAYTIFSWRKVSLSIENRCDSPVRTINEELQALLLEFMRLKDEAEDPAGDDTEVYKKERRDRKVSHEETIHLRVNKGLDDLAMIDRIEKNAALDPFIRHAGEWGSFFDSGELKACCISQSGEKDAILLPGEPTTVVSISPRCSREKIVNALIKL